MKRHQLDLESHTSLWPRQEYKAMNAAILAAKGRIRGSSETPSSDSGNVANRPRGNADEIYQCAGITPHSLLLQAQNDS